MRHLTWPAHAMLVAALLGAVAAVFAQGAAPLSLERLRAVRHEAAHRPRRIIANNDGCDVLYFAKNQELTVDNFLAERTTGIAGSQVGTIAYCTISSGFSFFTHHTKVGTVLTRQGADYGILPDTRNVAQDLIDLGTDCLQAVVGFGHQHQMEVFWSMRMDDTHDVEYRPDKPYLLYPPLKVEHPEWLVGEVAKPTPKGRWSSVDYGRPEIRDLAFRYLEEVCQGYDVDGVELDFFRHLCFFKSTAHGEQATDADRAAMTELMQRVRAMTEQVGMARGRPILMSVRVPDSAGFCRDMGLDLERWMADGLVDILVTTCYFRLNPWSVSAELGHQYDVPVYACLSDSRVTGETRFKRGSIEGYRGRAVNAWAAGVDGIHIFNRFHAGSPVFREVGDPQVLAPLDKLFFTSCRDGNPESWLAGGDQYQTAAIMVPGRSRSLVPGQAVEVPLEVGEDFAGRTPRVTLHLELPRLTRPEQVQVALNDQPLTGGTLQDGWLDLPVRPDQLVRGANQVTVTLDPQQVPRENEWDIVWQAPAPPGEPWTRDRGSERTEERLVDDALLLADRGTISGDYLYHRYLWGAAAGGEAVVEARVKVISGSSFVIVNNGVAHERLGLWPDHLDLWTNRNLRHELDTTDDFHLYRIEMKGEDLQVFVDGKLAIDATGKFKVGQRYPNELAFGAANSGMEGEALWQMVRGRATGQPWRDLVISVTYPKG